MKGQQKDKRTTKTVSYLECTNVSSKSSTKHFLPRSSGAMGGKRQSLAPAAPISTPPVAAAGEQQENSRAKNPGWLAGAAAAALDEEVTGAAWAVEPSRPTCATRLCAMLLPSAMRAGIRQEKRQEKQNKKKEKEKQKKKRKNKKEALVRSAVRATLRRCQCAQDKTDGLALAKKTRGTFKKTQAAV